MNKRAQSHSSVRLYNEYGILVNENPAIIPADKDLHLTTRSEIFWQIAIKGDYVGLVSSYEKIRLGDLLSDSQFRRLIILAEGNPNYGAIFLLGLHKECTDRIIFMELNGITSTSDQWLVRVRRWEGNRGRLFGVRQKAMLLIMRFREEGIPDIDISRLHEEYQRIFGEPIGKDVILRALALRKKDIYQTYRPQTDRGIIKTTRAKNRIGGISLNPNTGRVTRGAR